jgi:hypothetical protein
MQAQGTVEVQLHSFLISAQDWGQWSSSHFGHYTTRKNSRCILSRKNEWVRKINVWKTVLARGIELYKLRQRSQSSVPSSLRVFPAFPTCPLHHSIHLDSLQARSPKPHENVLFFDVYGPVHRESMSIIVQQDATIYSLLYRVINLQEPSVLYIGQACRYPQNVAFYIFFKQI